MLDQNTGSGGLPSVHGDGLSLVMPTALEPLVASQNANAELDGQLSPVVALHGFSRDMAHPEQAQLPSSQVCASSVGTCMNALGRLTLTALAANVYTSEQCAPLPIAGSNVNAASAQIIIGGFGEDSAKHLVCVLLPACTRGATMAASHIKMRLAVDYQKPTHIVRYWGVWWQT